MNRHALLWKKSRASGSSNCVEVAVGGETVYVRDSKAVPEGPMLAFTRKEWDAFITGVQAGEFTLYALDS
jgi:Domain of unknown function (DUF397)